MINEPEDDDTAAQWQYANELYRQRSKDMNASNIDSLTFDQLVPKNSSYLSKEDVGEDGVILTIKGFKMEVLKSDDGEDERMVLHFIEAVKPMVLNRTNAQTIGVVTGAKTAGEARGKQIVVFNDITVGFGGKITGGLRIRKVGAAPAQAPRRGDDLSDVPF